jgi:integrase
MANRKVILVRNCKTENGWRRFPVVQGKNGRIRPNWVLVDGEPREYPDGHYEIRSYQGSKMEYKNVGNNAVDALLERDKKVNLLVARDAAPAGGAVLVEEAVRIPLSRQSATFIKKAHDRGSHVAAQAYKLAIDEFLMVTGRTYADQVTEEDVSKYQRALEKRGCGLRTVHNRNMNIKAFLRECGVDAKAVKIKAPKVDKTKPGIYEPNELTPFFSSLTDPYHQLIFNLLLKTGLREQEAMYLEWDDLSFRKESPSLRIHSKPHLGFRVKDKEERSVPLPSDLVDRLKEYRAIHPTKHFVIGNKHDRPHTKLLRLLKGLVRDAGLNCGRCESCVARNECEKWFLHKFRATYCTQLLRSGLDLSTVQELMGHTDIASTMRYLRPQEKEHTQAKINTIEWGT